MSAADCERWENRLLDLAYGEIEESDEREVRAHLDGCEHCRRSLEKLGRGRALARHLEQVEPPADAMQVVLRAARDKALEIEASRAAAVQAKLDAEANAEAAKPAAPSPSHKSWWSVVLGVVMAPQFAMATLLLLTVGVGLWWFPDGHGGGSNTPPLLSEPSTVAVGPEALTPAEPLHFDVDPRTGRVEAHHETAEAVEVERPRGIHVPASDRSDPVGSEAAVATVVPQDVVVDDLEASVHLEDGESAGVVVDGVLPDVVELQSEMGVVLAPAPHPASSPEVARVAESERREASDEVEAPSVDGPTLLAAGLLRQARELAATHRDREAIAQYEALLTRYRSSPEAPTAMIEVAGCYRRIGAVGRARGWLERAAAHPAVAAEAHRELLRLGAPPAEVGPDEAATASEN